MAKSQFNYSKQRRLEKLLDEANLSGTSDEWLTSQGKSSKKKAKRNKVIMKNKKTKNIKNRKRRG